MSEIKATAFVKRPKIEETDEMQALPTRPYEDFKNLDRPKYQWRMVGDDKYSRYMYCENTKAKRSLTMGEFYQDNIVD